MIDTAILTAENIGSSFYSSTYRELSLGGLQSPTAVDYDPNTELVYWTDEEAATINRASLDGSFQQVVLWNIGGKSYLDFVCVCVCVCVCVWGGGGGGWLTKQMGPG